MGQEVYISLNPNAIVKKQLAEIWNILLALNYVKQDFFASFMKFL